MKYVMIGHSFASTFAVETIRKVDGAGSIRVVGDERVRLYSRAMLHEFLAGAVGEQFCWLRDADWAARHEVDLIAGRRAVRVDSRARLVELDDGRGVPYDRLLIACGGRPLVPPGIRGHGQFEQVYSFTRWADVVQLRRFGAGGTVAVLGAGLIGLQCADALRHLGCSVHVVELADRVLPLAADREAADLIAAILRDDGIKLHLSDSIAEIRGQGHAVGSVLLQSGREIPCQSVVIAAGVRPNVEWLASSGIAIERGILVDDHMRTNLPDVYAAGDCAQGLERISGKQMVLATIPVASKHGLIAGYNMAGVDRTFDGEIPLNALQFGEIQVVSYGYVQDADGVDSLRFVDEKRRVYRKMLIRDGRLIGALLLRAIDRAGLYRQLIQKGLDVTPIQGRLTALDFGPGDLPADLREQMYTRSPTLANA